MADSRRERRPFLLAKLQLDFDRSLGVAAAHLGKALTSAELGQRDMDIVGERVLEKAEHTEERRFAAAIGPHEHGQARYLLELRVAARRAH